MEKIDREFALETERCRLRAPHERDIARIYSATRCPGFNDGMPWDPPSSEMELLEPFRRHLELWDSGTAFSFSIEQKSDGLLIGRISIRPTKTVDVWDIGFWLHPDHQGMGFMREAASAVLDFGFTVLGAMAIEACYATWNLKSRRVLEAVGMSEVEFVPQGFLKRGSWVPEFRMRMERPHWKQRMESPKIVT